MDTMVVLNIYGKIEPTLISKKLGLYIANLPKKKQNNWNEELYNEISIAHKKIEQDSKEYKLSNIMYIKEMYKNVCNNKCNTNINDCRMLHEIVNNMIYIYFDYNYEDMPLGNYESNCFDGRFCEEDYTEKIINFITKEGLEENTPNFIYSSNHDSQNPYLFFLY